MCGLYYPHPSNTIFISKEIKDDAEGENAYEEDEDKLQVKKIQPTYLRISSRYDPCMPMMTSKKMWCCSSPLQNNQSAEAFPHALNLESVLTFCFSHQQNIPSPKCPLFLFLCPPIFSTFILIPLSAFEPPRFLPLQHQNPLHQHGNHTPHYFSCTRGQLTPFSFQLASPPRIHMDSWWAARNPNQGPKWAYNIA